MNGFERRVLALLALLLTLAACARDAGDRAPDSYQARRATFETVLTREGPAYATMPDTMEDFRAVLDDLPGVLAKTTYPGPLGAMKAWMFVPDVAREGGRPALLLLHGGWGMFAFQEYRALRIFADAGYVILWPSWRGEVGNPGVHEFWFGEVEDAAAAARWLAAHPAVDPERVYALGWSAGGGVAALLALWEDVPLRHTATSGGLYHPDHVRTQPDPGPPFDTTVAEEIEIRTLPGNFEWMLRPHFAYIETEAPRWNRSIAAAKLARETGDTLIHVIMVPGDHYSAFPVAVRRYFELIEGEERARR